MKRIKEHSNSSAKQPKRNDQSTLDSFFRGISNDKANDVQLTAETREYF